MKTLSLVFALLLTPVFAKKPNILVILADDMGYGDLSCFGSTQIPTPHIDALAAGGVRCTTGYVSGSVCAPSRAGLMTGRYQESFGFDHNLSHHPTVQPEWLAVPKDEKMMPAYLKEAGYATAIIGKWHLGGKSIDWHHPLSRGFDYYFGRYGGHGHFPTVQSKSIFRGREPVTEIDVPYTTDWYTKEAIDFIDRAPANKPWFVYLAHDTPHTPLQAKEEDIARFSHIEDKKRRIYAAMQHCLDENVGKLVAHLKAKKQFDNTLIVFFSDNGGPTSSNASLNAPLRGQKAMILDGGVRVPFIFSWPGGLPSGKTYHQPFISLDLLPTFLAAAQLDRSKLENKKRPLHGKNLLPYLRGEKGDTPPHETLYWRILMRTAGIRHQHWKLIRFPDRPAQLYDLRTDISEKNDLANKHPEVVTDLLKKLFAWEKTHDRPPSFLGSIKWMEKHMSMYDADYQLEQPK